MLVLHTANDTFIIYCTQKHFKRGWGWGPWANAPSPMAWLQCHSAPASWKSSCPKFPS